MRVYLFRHPSPSVAWKTLFKNSVILKMSNNVCLRDESEGLTNTTVSQCDAMRCIVSGDIHKDMLRSHAALLFEIIMT